MSGDRRVLWFLGLCAACASHPPPSPFFGDEAYLKFGVDPRDEAAKIIEQHATLGEPLALRIEGHHFTALGFMDRSGRATRVRALTERGIQLALDPELSSALIAGVRYALLAAPIATTQDADGDGFEEFFVEQRAATGNCVLVFRVRDVGFIDPVPIKPRFFDREYCPSAVLDLDNDGRAELAVDLALSGFDGETPHVRAALWPVSHRFEAPGNPAAMAHYIAGERSIRTAQLADARRRLDFGVVYRASIELAALGYLLGEPAADQIASFDAAAVGLVLTEPQQLSMKKARQRIFAVWNAPASQPKPTDTRPTPAELVHHAGP